MMVMMMVVIIDDDDDDDDVDVDDKSFAPMSVTFCKR